MIEKRPNRSKNKKERCFIYKILNILNGKLYIGQTNNISLRWSQHKSNAKYNKGNQIITRAISKYGKENFEFCPIVSCETRDDANTLEVEIIARYDALNPDVGYNIARGGWVSWHTPEICKKISENLRKYHQTHVHWGKGKPLSEEWRKNISIASMGKKGTNLGKKFNDEWRLKMSRAAAGQEKVSKRRFLPEVEEKICWLYQNDGLSTYKLGQQFECSRTTIADILYRHKIETRQSSYTGHSNGRNIFTPEQEQEICKLYLTGKFSRRELAEKFKCGKTTMRDILLRNGVKL